MMNVKHLIKVPVQRKGTQSTSVVIVFLLSLPETERRVSALRGQAQARSSEGLGQGLGQGKQAS